MAIFQAAKDDLYAALTGSVSGQELIVGGFQADVQWASKLNTTNCVPQLQTLERTYEDVGPVE